MMLRALLLMITMMMMMMTRKGVSAASVCCRVARGTFSNDFCVKILLFFEELLTIFINSRRRPQLWREWVKKQNASHHRTDGREKTNTQSEEEEGFKYCARLVLLLLWVGVLVRKNVLQAKRRRRRRRDNLACTNFPSKDGRLRKASAETVPTENVARNFGREILEEL